MRRTKSHLIPDNREIASHPVVLHTKSICFHGTKCVFRGTPQSRSRFLRVAPDHHPATPWNQIHKPPKCQLVRLEVRIDVRVIVLKRGDNQIIRMVMKEFWAAIPECRLVFIPFQDELLPAAKPVALPKILRYPSDQEIWPLRCRVKNPCQHRCGCRLAMSPAHDNRML